MSVVVGIDPSLTSAGLAILRDGTPIYLDSIGVDDKVKDWSHRIRRISLQASNIIHWINDRALPDLAVIEQPLTVGPNNSADSTFWPISVSW